MKIHILDKAKKKKFLKEINHLGITKIKETLIRTGKDRIRAYSGDLNTEELWDIWRLLPIEGIGLYIGRDMLDKHGVRDIRLSIDGLHTYQEQITHNILQLTEEQEEQWFKGKNIELQQPENETKGTFVAIQSSDGKDFIGTGKIGQDGTTLYNFLPKERRRKSQTI